MKFILLFKTKWKTNLYTNLWLSCSSSMESIFSSNSNLTRASDFGLWSMKGEFSTSLDSNNWSVSSLIILVNPALSEKSVKIKIFFHKLDTVVIHKKWIVGKIVVGVSFAQIISDIKETFRDILCKFSLWGFSLVDIRKKSEVWLTQIPTLISLPNNSQNTHPKGVGWVWQGRQIKQTK